MKIFVDFDDVIFNTKKYIADYGKMYSKNGVASSDLAKYKKTITEICNGKGVPYNHKHEIESMREKSKKEKKEILKDVEIFLGKLEKYVFSDAYNFLDSVGKKNLFLVSYGDKEYQKNKKIKGSGMSKYFSKIIVNTENKLDFILKTSGRKEDLLKEKIFFIDDRPDNLERIEKAKKEIITIRMRRPEGRYSNLDCSEADWEVRSLKDALRIIDNLKN